MGERYAEVLEKMDGLGLLIRDAISASEPDGRQDRIVQTIVDINGYLEQSKTDPMIKYQEIDCAITGLSEAIFGVQRAYAESRTPDTKMLQDVLEKIEASRQEIRKASENPLYE